MRHPNDYRTDRFSYKSLKGKRSLCAHRLLNLDSDSTLLGTKAPYTKRHHVYASIAGFTIDLELSLQFIHSLICNFVESSVSLLDKRRTS